MLFLVPMSKSALLAGSDDWCEVTHVLDGCASLDSAGAQSCEQVARLPRALPGLERQTRSQVPTDPHEIFNLFVSF